MGLNFLLNKQDKSLKSLNNKNKFRLSVFEQLMIRVSLKIDKRKRVKDMVTKDFVSQTEIREISGEEDLAESIRIIRDSFITVARDFNLTEENCPSNPAFISMKKLKELQSKGVKFFGLFTNDRQSGFVAIEKASESLFYMEKLAVLPEFRHAGSGKKLMDFVF
jgi:ribosomal protein S18 acetylase RimI-like enzyme